MKRKPSFIKSLIVSVALVATVQSSVAELVLDGVDGVATAPTSTAYDKVEGEGYTVECWFKTTTTSQGSLVARIDESTVDGFSLYIEADGQIGYRNETTDNQAGRQNLGSNLNDGAWHHVAMVTNSVDTATSNTEIFIDGVSANIYAHAYHYYGFANTKPLTIGDGDMHGYFNGSIKNVRVWQTARAVADINADMNNDVPTSNVVPSELVANFILNETTGTTAVDSSTTTNNATLSGGAIWPGVAVADDQEVALPFGDSSVIITLTGLGFDTFNTPSATTNGGTVTLDASYSTNGQVTYTPAEGFAGTDTFTFTTEITAGGTSSAATVTVNVGGLYFVDSAATGASDGSTWTDAFTTVEAGLSAGVTGSEVWIATGTYSTTTAVNAYTVPAGIKLYGGFAGTEAAVSERSGILTTNKTTLTQTAGNTRVIFMTAGSTVDGFEITGGDLTSSPADGDAGGGGLATGGAGVYMQSNTTLANSIVSNCTTPTGSNIVGGGICMQTIGSNITIDSCHIINNQAKYGGGMGAGINPNASVVNCVIANNSAVGGYGGGYATGSSSGSGTITFTNCTVVRNSTSSDSAGIHAASGTNCNINNSINWGNSNTNIAGTYTNSGLEGQTSGTNTVNLNGTNDDAAGPNFHKPSTVIGYNATITDQFTANWRLTSSATELIDAGDNSLIPAGFTTDITGGARIIDTIVEPGAYEFDPSYTPALGLEVAQVGAELTWTIGEEIGVKEYQVIDVATGEVIAVVAATGLDAYSVTLPEGVTAKLVVVDNSGFTQTFYPENGDIRTVAYSLSKGWNLITITTEDADLAKLNKAIAGELWVWDGEAYQVTTDPEPTQGVWVYAPVATEVTVSGTKSDAEMTISTGWNLVGPVENSPAPAEATLIYNWNDIYESIATDQGVLLQGVGYWIFSF